MHRVYAHPFFWRPDESASANFTCAPSGVLLSASVRISRLGYLSQHQFQWLCQSYCFCCCSAYLSSCHRTASDANLLDDPRTFHYNDYFVIGGIRTCLGVSDDPMFLWISSNSCPLNLLLVRSHQAEIIIVKRLIQGRKQRDQGGGLEPRSFDQGRRKNDAFTHSATLPNGQAEWVNGSSELHFDSLLVASTA